MTWESERGEQSLMQPRGPAKSPHKMFDSRKSHDGSGINGNPLKCTNIKPRDEKPWGFNAAAGKLRQAGVR